MIWAWKRKHRVCPCMYVHVRLPERTRGWTFKYWANSLRFTERAWCTPPYQSPFTERVRQRSYQRLKLPLSNHLFRLLFPLRHTCFSFLPPSCICSFLEHLQSSSSPMKLLACAHLITTLTYPTCCAGCNIQLMKHIRSLTRHVHAHTHTQRHVYLHTLGTPTDS